MSKWNAPSSVLFENAFSAPPQSAALSLYTDGQLKYFEGSTEDIDFSEVAIYKK